MIGAGVNSHFNQFIIEVERTIESGDQRGFYKHLKGTVGMEGARVKESSASGTKMVYCWGIKGNLLILVIGG